jgi:hypothetical protein
VRVEGNMTPLWLLGVHDDEAILVVVDEVVMAKAADSLRLGGNSGVRPQWLAGWKQVRRLNSDP